MKNPDSAKALRIRGRALKELGEFERSIKDLAASQQIDYDDGAAEDLKFVTDKMKEIGADHVKIKLEVSFILDDLDLYVICIHTCMHACISIPSRSLF